MSSSVLGFPNPARTILIVDDQPSVLATLTYVFNARNYSVLLAAKGLDALAMAETHAFDGAVIDLHMPGMDGITVARTLFERIKAQDKKVPVWVMTAAHTPEAARLAVAAGARGLLRKPFDADEVIKEIEASLASPPPGAGPTDLPASTPEKVVA